MLHILKITKFSRNLDKRDVRSVIRFFFSAKGNSSTEICRQITAVYCGTLDRMSGNGAVTQEGGTD